MKKHLFFILALLPAAAAAVNNAPQALHPFAQVKADQLTMEPLTAGSDSYFVFWASSNDSSEHPSLFAQRFDLNGAAAWPLPGIQISGELSDSLGWDICADGATGAFTATVEAGLLKIRRLDHEGKTLWQQPVSQNMHGTANDPFLTADLVGGAYVAWVQENSGKSIIWVQRWNAAGKPLWPAPGVRVALNENLESLPVVLEDGRGGVVIGWKSASNGSTEQRVQRLSGNGERLWQDQAVIAQMPAGDLRDRIMMASPGLGGVVTSWMNGVAGRNRLFFQRVDPEGKRGWEAGGVTINPPSYEQWNPVIVGDGRGNVWIGWEEITDSGAQKVKLARRAAPSGALWNAGEINLAGTPGSQGRLRLELDSNNGIFAAWIDNRTTTGVYLQHINSEGQLLFGDGLPVETGLDHPQRPRMVILPGQHVAVIWAEEITDRLWDLKTRVISPK